MPTLRDRVFTVLVVDNHGKPVPGATVLLFRDGKPKTQVTTGDGPVTIQASAANGLFEIEVSYPPDFSLRQKIGPEEPLVRVVIPRLGGPVATARPRRRKASFAFVSYSRDDLAFAQRLVEDLTAAGARMWLDQIDIAPGEEWPLAIERALEECSHLLVILSPSAVASKNVRDELSFALGKEKVVIPILYQNCKIPFRLDGIQYLDFRSDYNERLKILRRSLDKK